MESKHCQECLQQQDLLFIYEQLFNQHEEF